MCVACWREKCVQRGGGAKERSLDTLMNLREIQAIPSRITYIAVAGVGDYFYWIGRGCYWRGM